MAGDQGVPVPGWRGSGTGEAGKGNGVETIRAEQSGLNILEPMQARLELRQKGF